MRKRLGFTLVELLGVIVVLAILALITIPIISNVVNDVRIKALKESANGLIEASNLYYAQYGSNNIRFDIDNNQISSSDTDNLLKYKGSIKSGTIILDKKGKVTVCITDGKNSAYKNYNDKKVTTIKGKVCNIKENSSIVYLDDDATIEAYDNTQLTELVTELQEKILTKEDIVNEIYPIGSIYISTTENTTSKVEEKFGGTWEQIESGRMLQSTSTSSGQIGGSTNATFTPTGTVGYTSLEVSQIPSHSHTGNTLNPSIELEFTSFNNVKNTGVVTRNSSGYTLSYAQRAGGSYYHNVSGWGSGSDIWHQYLTTNFSGIWTGETSSEGGDQPHTHTFTGTSQTINITPPYITVYMYKRIA